MNEDPTLARSVIPRSTATRNLWPARIGESSRNVRAGLPTVPVVARSETGHNSKLGDQPQQVGRPATTGWETSHNSRSETGHHSRLGDRPQQ